MSSLKSILIDSNGKLISGETIAKKLGISRIAVWKQIHSLQKEGFKIETVPQSGYRLLQLPDLLDEDIIKKWMSKKNIADFYGGFKYFFSIESTQQTAKLLAEKKLFDKILIASEKQTGSYGRMRRAWYAEQGGLWFSILLTPRIMPQQSTLLTLLFSLSVRKVLQQYSEKKFYVKWPNDIYVDNMKICGIITELSAELDRTNWVVIGAGININNPLHQNIKDIAVSLKDVTGTSHDRTKILISILEDFRERYNIFEKQGFKVFKKEYEESSLWLKKGVTIKATDQKSFSGIYKGIDDNGFMILSDNKNKSIVVPSGDISVL